MKRYLFLLVLLVSLPCVGHAQSVDSLPRKKVAVVLSGGGAKGMAHIGVLKVIEKAGIPVDIITGTSMGSIVGGLYSCGWNAQALDSIVRCQDWVFLLSDQEDYYSQSLKMRERMSTYILQKSYTLGHKKLSEQGGFVKGTNLAKLFQRLTYGYNDTMDFNQLPIPFACVATNIINNTEYDFHKGVLAQAMRTSMSIPGVFSPVKMDSMVLVDGGLRNNYPADIARQMGADYIIGATVQGKPKTADDLTNSAQVISQIVDVNCKNKYDDNLAITDIPIRVNTSGYSAASFTPAAIDTLIRRGEEEAMKHWDELMALKRKLGLPDDYKPEPIPYYNKAREPVDWTASVHPSRPKNDKITAAVGVRFDTEELVAMQMNGLYESSKVPLDIEATLRLGKRILAHTQLLWTPKKYAQWGFTYNFRHNDVNYYHEGSKDFNVTYNHHQASVGMLGMRLKNLSIDLSANWDFYHFNHVLMSSDFRDEDLDFKHDNHFFSYQARFHYDSENLALFPTRGSKFVASYGYFTDNFTSYKDHTGFSEVAGMWRTSLGITRRLIFQPMVYGRLIFGTDVPFCRQNFIGGMWFSHYADEQMPFIGVHHVEMVDRHLLAAQAKFQQQLTDNNYILLKVAVGQNADDLDDIFSSATKLGYQLEYFYKTIIGPIGATLSYSNITDEVNFFINLGFEF